jgi:hypothetical protein
MKHFFSLLFILTLLFTSTTQAQTASTWRVGFGINAGAATSDAFEYALGGDIRIQKDFSQHLSGTFTTGFSHFFEKDHFAAYNQYGSPYNVIPVKLGLKYFVGDNLYLGGEAGAGFAFEQWGTSFVWSPSVGLAFKNGMDISIKYEDYTRDKATKDIALRLAYSFGARKIAPHKREAEPTNGLQWGLALSQGLTTGSFQGYVFGIEGNVIKPLSSNVEATFSVGYSHAFRNNQEYFHTSDPLYSSVGYGYDYTKRDVVPVKAGLRLYLGNLFYLGGEAGVAFASGSNTSFVYTPSMGVKFKNGIDVGVKYDNYSNYKIEDVLSVKVGYHFK